jgi:DNA gyrase subunit B
MDNQSGQQVAYEAEDIEILEGIEAVRKRPAMYIGDTGDRGLHHLVHEVVDNSIDEAMAGYCDEVEVKLFNDGSVSIQDDGRGIPVAQHEEIDRPALEVVLTTLHAGGKFNQNVYKVSGGLHGVGISVVNALSEWLEVDVWRNNQHYYESFEKGIPTHDMEVGEETDKSGTRIRFKPDDEIFTNTTFEYDLLAGRLRELAYLNEGLQIRLIDERDNRSDTFLYEGGIVEYLEHLNENKQTIHDDIIGIEEKQDDIQLKMAMQYHDGYNTSLSSFVNNINTQEGGTHVSGFRTALTRALNEYAKNHDMFEGEDTTPNGNDFREGMTGIISVNVPEPQFEGQTKTKLGNSEVRGVVSSVVYQELSTFLEEHPDCAQAIIEKALDAARARAAAKKAKEKARRKSALTSGDMPGKLADCSSRKIEESELFIVEGDSAGGSAKQARDRNFQAILPIKGKILNAQKARIDRILDHDELKTIISAIGTGIGEETMDMEELRYGKIIIMTDADVDGSHIRTLLLTFFFRHMRQLLIDERVYIACPPLYRIQRRNKERYIRTEKEMRSALIDMGIEGCVFKRRSDDLQLEGQDLEEFVDLIASLEDLRDQIQEKGINAQRYFELGQQRGQYPLYQVDSCVGTRLCFSEDEVDEVLQEVARETGKEPVTLHGDDFQPEGGDHQVRVTELHGEQEVEDLVDQLDQLGFEPEHYLEFSSDTPDANVEEPTLENSPFVLECEGEQHPVQNLTGLLHAIQENGEQGVSIQRYKGLGEMNPQQLWETTMDPETRVLEKMKVENAAEAERLFDILMGDAVKPRREFIKQFALDVSRLDV